MAARNVPKIVRKIVATQLSPKFRESTAIVESTLPTPGPTDIIVKNRFVGINATDINITAGRYDRTIRPPFDCGLEAVGEVVEAGAESKMSPGQPVMYMLNGSFSEYKLLSSKYAVPVPSVRPEFLSVILSGTTAAISLDKVGEMKAGEKVLITAAAGGTGQFAVQLAKLAGCHVIGTCSSPEKVQFLKSIGCDRPINYKTENLKEILKSEYPKGIDIVYETIGGEMFDICVNSLAQKGRLIIIGFITGYESAAGFKPNHNATLAPKLLMNSASIRGFMIFQFAEYMQEYIMKLMELVIAGKLKLFADNGETSPKGPFIGLEKVADAVEYLYSSKSKGKVVVELNPVSKSRL